MLDLTAKERMDLVKVYAVTIAKAGLITATAAGLHREPNNAELAQVLADIKAATDLLIEKYNNALARRGTPTDAGAIEDLRQQLTEEMAFNAYELIQQATEELKRLIGDEQKKRYNRY